jgi:uncharacterized protein with HEPN domain
MPSDRVRLALFNIRDNIGFAREFVAGLSFEAFRDDRRTFYAATRCIEIISEAARRLPAAMRERHSELPWRAIMGVGNVYRHDYDNAAEEFVWGKPIHPRTNASRRAQFPSSCRRVRPPPLSCRA